MITYTYTPGDKIININNESVTVLTENAECDVTLGALFEAWLLYNLQEMSASEDTIIIDTLGLKCPVRLTYDDLLHDNISPEQLELKELFLKKGKAWVAAAKSKIGDFMKWLCHDMDYMMTHGFMAAGAVPANTKDMMKKSPDELIKLLSPAALSITDDTIELWCDCEYEPEHGVCLKFNKKGFVGIE